MPAEAKEDGQVSVEKLDMGAVVERMPPFVPAPHSYLEWAGTYQMVFVLCVICGLAMFFACAWSFAGPTIEDVKALLGSASTPEQVLELYSTLQAQHAESYGKIFQLVVLSGLVPLFTLLAGYVFGKSQAAKGPPKPDDDEP